MKKLGIFTVQQQQDGKICMNFPIRAAQQVEDYPDILRQALTKPFKNVYINAQAYIVEYESVQDVLNEQPNLELLKQLGQLRTAITAQSSVDVSITASEKHSMTAYRVISLLLWALQKILLQGQFTLQLHRFGQKNCSKPNLWHIRPQHVVGCCIAVC